MKKKVLLTLGILILASVSGTAFSKSYVSSELADAIKMYKVGNYSQCYVRLDDAIAKDPGNALCYYYKAITAAQIGKKAEAISNYEKVLNLTPEGNNLSRYARKGKTCLENPEQCNASTEESAEDKFIKSSSKVMFSDKVKDQYEKFKIDEMRRSINRNDDIAPSQFREYRDFSSMNIENGTPSNDDIVAAIKVLQKAGLYNNMNNAYSDLSLLTGNQYGGFNMGNSASLNQQLIQSMLTNNMSLGF